MEVGDVEARARENAARLRDGTLPRTSTSPRLEDVDGIKRKPRAWLSRARRAAERCVHARSANEPQMYGTPAELAC